MKLLISSTGSSGSILTHTLVDYLLMRSDCPYDISLISTKTANEISKTETGADFASKYHQENSGVKYYPDNSFYAPPASGSTFDYDALVVIPASMGFLSRCSTGTSSTLSERAFDVALKEGTKIVVVPREMPFSKVHLQTLLRLSDLGIIVCPACSSYYNSPVTAQDMTDNVVGKVLKLIGVDNNLYKKWSVNA